MAANDVPCCETMFWVYLVICVALVCFAGLMSGLTLGLMSLSLVDLEVLIKAGQPEYISSAFFDFNRIKINLNPSVKLSSKSPGKASTSHLNWRTPNASPYSSRHQTPTSYHQTALTRSPLSPYIQSPISRTSLSASPGNSSSTSPAGMTRPNYGSPSDVVLERIAFRILFSVGVPLLSGFALLQIMSVLKERELWDVPIWVPFLTTFVTFGTSALGIAYGSLSSSLTAENEGSFLGFEQFEKNWNEMWKEEDETSDG